MSAVRIRLSPQIEYLFRKIETLYLKLSQAIKSLRRIPWCSEAMKGVATNEMFRGTGSKFWSENTRMRKLFKLLLEYNKEERANLVNWNILVTRGKESKSDSLSSGERNGISLNFIYVKGCGTVTIEIVWLDETDWLLYHSRWKSCNRKLSYFKIVSQVGRDTWNPFWICEDHLVRLNIPE